MIKRRVVRGVTNLAPSAPIAEAPASSDAAAPIYKDGNAGKRKRSSLWGRRSRMPTHNTKGAACVNTVDAGRRGSRANRWRRRSVTGITRTKTSAMPAFKPRFFA